MLKRTEDVKGRFYMGPKQNMNFDERVAYMPI
jgi:hypothetical protein